MHRSSSTREPRSSNGAAELPPPFLPSALRPYRYTWPSVPLDGLPALPGADGSTSMVHRLLPESAGELAQDSRWPAFFPSPICLVTTGNGEAAALERVVGASIVNRFPYIVALSVCRTTISSRHHSRKRFMEMLEDYEDVVVQFLPPGAALDSALSAIAQTADDQCAERIARSGLEVRQGRTVKASVLAQAYLVYEARLVRPSRDFEGQRIFARPFVDVGSHRVYYCEITAIQLRADIATGQSQIRWRSLPAWRSRAGGVRGSTGSLDNLAYQKGYTPHYSFPSGGTIQFDADEVVDGMHVKLLPPLPEDQLEVDNDRARWPCFFPSSLGMITTWHEPGVPNVMPCGSTTIVSRHPFVVAPCVSYAAINERYAKRATLDAIRRTRRFGCGVAYIDEGVVSAIRYCGNISIERDREKVRNSGLRIEPSEWAPVLIDLPVHFECEVVEEVRLGTHIMFFGEVRRVLIRPDVTPENPLTWYPWADVAENVGLGESPSQRSSILRQPA